MSDATGTLGGQAPGLAAGARRQAEDQLPCVVGGAMHALQAQAAVYARMRLPEELPVRQTRSKSAT